MSALFRPSFGYKRENLGAEEAGKSGKSGRAASETDNAVVAARSPALEDVLGVTHPPSATASLAGARSLAGTIVLTHSVSRGERHTKRVRNRAV